MRRRQRVGALLGECLPDQRLELAELRCRGFQVTGTDREPADAAAGPDGEVARLARSELGQAEARLVSVPTGTGDVLAPADRQGPAPVGHDAVSLGDQAQAIDATLRALEGRVEAGDGQQTIAFHPENHQRARRLAARRPGGSRWLGRGLGAQSRMRGDADGGSRGCGAGRAQERGA